MDIKKRNRRIVKDRRHDTCEAVGERYGLTPGRVSQITKEFYESLPQHGATARIRRAVRTSLFI